MIPLSLERAMWHLLNTAAYSAEGDHILVDASFHEMAGRSMMRKTSFQIGGDGCRDYHPGMRLEHNGIELRIAQ